MRRIQRALRCLSQHSHSHTVFAKITFKGLNLFFYFSLQHQTLSLICAGDALHAAVEDDLERELAALGITLNKRVLSKDDFNAAMTSGDFHMVFSETWGAPYDPVSFATGWMSNDQAD